MSDENNEVDRVIDEMVEDILRAPDAEILAQAVEAGDDPEKIAAAGRALLERTKLVAGKAKLTAAKEALTVERQGGRLALSSATVRDRYKTLAKKDGQLATDLTMAARNGKGQSARDEETALEDLAELGAFDEDSG